MELIPAYTRQRAGRGANFGRKVRKRGDVITIQRNRISELAACDLHAVAGIPGEADHRLIDFFPPVFGQRRINKCRHKLPDPILEKLLNDFPREEHGSVNRMTRAKCRISVGCARREPAWQGYHTGSPAAGRESAARAMCSSEKDVRSGSEVACCAEIIFVL